mmetsp:Transcript_40838/g.102807  ORF Transcript_40838/g.102807 Transcript_40838/m.102807 type:complete len:146 (-) Transcript_40838:108-545(-)
MCMVNQRLTSLGLDLSENVIDASDFKQLVDFLPTNTSLTSLSLTLSEQPLAGRSVFEALGLVRSSKHNNMLEVLGLALGANHNLRSLRLEVDGEHTRSQVKDFVAALSSNAHLHEASVEIDGDPLDLSKLFLHNRSGSLTKRADP